MSNLISVVFVTWFFPFASFVTFTCIDTDFYEERGKLNLDASQSAEISVGEKENVSPSPFSCKPLFSSRTEPMSERSWARVNRKTRTRDGKGETRERRYSSFSGKASLVSRVASSLPLTLSYPKDLAGIHRPVNSRASSGIELSNPEAFIEIYEIYPLQEANRLFYPC